MTTEPINTDPRLDLPLNLNEDQRRLLDHEPAAVTEVRSAAATAAELEDLAVLGDVALLQVQRIETDEEADAVGALFTSASDAIKTIDSRFDPICASQHRTWKSMRELWNDVKAKPLEIRVKSRALLQDYATRKQRALDAIREAEERAARKRAEAAQLEEAQALQDSGQSDAADVLLETPTAAIVETTTPEKPAVAGVTFVDEYRVEIIDPHKIPDVYVIRTIDERSILSLAKSMKDPERTMQAVPGCRVWVEKRPDRKGSR